MKKYMKSFLELLNVVKRSGQLHIEIWQLVKEKLTEKCKF